MVLITIVTGANLNQLITGGPHIVCNFDHRFGVPTLRAAYPNGLPRVHR